MARSSRPSQYRKHVSSSKYSRTRRSIARDLVENTTNELRLRCLRNLYELRRGELYEISAKRTQNRSANEFFARHTLTTQNNVVLVSLVYGLLYAVLCDENEPFYIINARVYF